MLPLSRLLYVDLDGTLVRTDTLWESLMLLLKHHPHLVFVLPFWLLRGKAVFKREVARRVVLDPASLPYHEDVVAYLEACAKEGCTITLATAADKGIAEHIAEHIPAIQHVLASDGTTNLSGQRKRQAIALHAAGQPFEYIGNGPEDRYIWEAASVGHIVGSSSQVERLFPTDVVRGKTFSSYATRVNDVLRAMRVQQWTKNILIFIPLLLAHRLTDVASLHRVIIGFVSLSLVASGNYLLNDLLDLQTDRRHPDKRYRPLASGRLSIPLALALSGVCIVIGLGLALLCGLTFFFWLLLGYLVATNIYSWYVKRLIVADVLMLAGFYVYRMLAGAVLADVILSAWLFAFALFFFLGLALLKRYSELKGMPQNEEKNGRGYMVQDLATLHMVGIGSHLLSLIVFALYLHSTEVRALYSAPWMLWGIVVVLLYWVIRLWILAGRGLVHDDPVLFALKDRSSYVVFIGAVFVLLLAATV